MSVAFAFWGLAERRQRFARRLVAAVRNSSAARDSAPPLAVLPQDILIGCASARLPAGTCAEIQAAAQLIQTDGPQVGGLHSGCARGWGTCQRDRPGGGSRLQQIPYFRKSNKFRRTS
jgi:hypothetical protein